MESANTATSSQPGAFGGTPQVPTKNVRVGDLLMQAGLITQEQLDKALAYQKGVDHTKLLGEILVELEFVTELQVMEQLAGAYGVPFARLSASVMDAAIIDLVPREFVEKQHVVPLFLIHNRLTVAISEPTNVFLIEEVERITGHQVQVVAVPDQDIRATLDDRRASNQVFAIDEFVDEIAEDELKVVDRSVNDVVDLESAAADSPVIKLVNYLISCAVQDGASDIHIEPEDESLRVRLRVDGALYEKIRPPAAMAPAVASRIKIMAGMDISERRIPQDGAITVVVNKLPIDLRVSTMPGKAGEKVVMRVIDKRNAVTGLDQIGLAPDMLEQFRDVIQKPNGVVLVTGPTGSGKSTTLYGVLNELLDETVNISTVEDPVEYNVAGVNQFQTNDKAGFTFATALRALLRQDPDIVMVGEIRDPETAKIATQAALTGHLVLSTLHTNDAPSAVTRLVNVGVESYLVAASIRCVLAQRLVRRICKSCKEPAEMSAQIAKMLTSLNPDHEPLETFFHGRGCSKCRQSGYAGRLGIYELLVPDGEMLDAISRDATLQELKRLAKDSSGFTALWQDGLNKIEAGLTTVEEIFSAAAA